MHSFRAVIIIIKVVIVLVSRAAPPARKQRVQVVAFNERQEQLRIYSNASIGTEKHFLGEFLVLLVSMREHNTKKKERSKQREKEREREKEKEKESWTTSSVEGKKQPPKHNHKNTTFCREKTQKRLVSQQIMASPEAAAILRELQGKNGNGVRF